jgi:thiosulfate/3-mercaptopyruvate sulfurtransferase
VVIDVRTEKEYLGKHKGYYSKKAPDISAINIPWQQFIDSHGLPNEAIKEQLRAVGITENRLIVVIDEMGVRSALVTMALRKLGFDKATNFAGGYMYLLGKK